MTEGPRPSRPASARDFGHPRRGELAPLCAAGSLEGGQAVGANDGAPSARAEPPARAAAHGLRVRARARRRQGAGLRGAGFRFFYSADILKHSKGLLTSVLLFCKYFKI